MSKHGGSPASGLVLPAGLEGLKPAIPEGMVLVPQEVVDARKQAEERKERALQLERRRVALEVFQHADATAHDAARANGTIASFDYDAGAAVVKESLRLADLLIAQTGGGI